MDNYIVLAKPYYKDKNGFITWSLQAIDEDCNIVYLAPKENLKNNL